MTQYCDRRSQLLLHFGRTAASELFINVHLQGRGTIQTPRFEAILIKRPVPASKDSRMTTGIRVVAIAAGRSMAGDQPHSDSPRKA